MSITCGHNNLSPTQPLETTIDICHRHSFRGELGGGRPRGSGSGSPRCSRSTGSRRCSPGRLGWGQAMGCSWACPVGAPGRRPAFLLGHRSLSLELLSVLTTGRVSRESQMGATMVFKAQPLKSPSIICKILSVTQVSLIRVRGDCTGAGRRPGGEERRTTGVS